MAINPVILFDGVCNLCNSSVQYVINHDPSEQFQFASLQSEAGQALLAKHHLPLAGFDSFVLIENDKAYTQSTAAIRVARKLKGPVNLLAVFIIIPAFIRDVLYKFVAANRYKWFGKKDSCMLPSPQLKDRFLTD